MYIIKYHKRYQEDSPETVGAQGGVLGDGVVELHNLERGGVDLNLQGMKKPKTNLLEQEPKRDLVPMRICARPYIMSERTQKL